MAEKVRKSKYYIIIRNVDMASSNNKDRSDLIDIIKSMRHNTRVQFPDSCLIVLTKSDLSKQIGVLEDYCDSCITTNQSDE